MNKYDSCPVCTWDKDVSSTSAILQRLHIQFTPSNPKFGGEKAVEARERFVSEGSSTSKDGANISARKGNTSAYAMAAQGKRTKKKNRFFLQNDASDFHPKESVTENSTIHTYFKPLLVTRKLSLELKTVMIRVKCEELCLNS